MVSVLFAFFALAAPPNLVHTDSPCIAPLRAFIVTPDNATAWNQHFPVNNPFYNGKTISAQPAFVALPSSIKQLQQALMCADQNHIPIAVRGGGHSFAGYSTTNSSGFVISLSHMHQVTWESDNLVTVGAGSTWSDVYAAFKAHGGEWVVVGGLCPSVGVASYIMGGGVGPIARKFGLGLDNVHSFQMFTANGSMLVTASATENPDLFWALRGAGGGNFGILTALTFNVHVGGPNYTWCKLCYDDVPGALQLMARYGPSMPIDTNLDGEFSLGNICMWFVFEGTAAEVDSRLIDFMGDHVSPQPNSVEIEEFNCFHEMIEKNAKDKGYSKYSSSPYTLKSCLLNLENLLPATKILAASTATNSTNPLPAECGFSLIHFGGNIKNVPQSATAFPWRNTEYMAYGSCGWDDGDTDTKIRVTKYLESVFDRLQPLCDGSYINFIDRTQTDWQRAYYGPNLERLVDIKKRWNPAGVGSWHFDQELDHVPINK